MFARFSNTDQFLHFYDKSYLVISQDAFSYRQKFLTPIDLSIGKIYYLTLLDTLTQISCTHAGSMAASGSFHLSALASSTLAFPSARVPGFTCRYYSAQQKQKTTFSLTPFKSEETFPKSFHLHAQQTFFCASLGRIRLHAEV